MAQDFRRYISRFVGQDSSGSGTIHTSNSFDTLIGINIANVTNSQVTTDVFVTSSSERYYLVKGAPVPAGGTLQLCDGGAKFVLQSGDALKVISSADSSLDVYVSAVEAISS